MIHRILLGLLAVGLVLATVTGFAGGGYFGSGADRSGSSGGWLLGHTIVAPVLIVVIVLVSLRFAERPKTRRSSAAGWLWLAASFVTVASVQVAMTSVVSVEDQPAWVDVHVLAAVTLVLVTPVAIVWSRKDPRSKKAPPSDSESSF